MSIAVMCALIEGIKAALAADCPSSADSPAEPEKKYPEVFELLRAMENELLNK